MIPTNDETLSRSVSANAHFADSRRRLFGYSTLQPQGTGGREREMEKKKEERKQTKRKRTTEEKARVQVFFLLVFSFRER